MKPRPHGPTAPTERFDNMRSEQTIERDTYVARIRQLEATNAALLAALKVISARAVLEEPYTGWAYCQQALEDIAEQAHAAIRAAEQKGR